MTRRRPSAAAATLAWQLTVASSLAAQTTGAIEAGVSAVDYESFLGTGAGYLVPAVRYEKPGLSVGAQASWVIFESGNQILQGSAAGGWLASVGGPVRAELSGSAGVAAYADAPAYGHVLLRGRAHVMDARLGGWLGGATGRSFFGDSLEIPYELALGGWTAESAVTLGATATRTWFGELAYLDVVATAHWVGEFLELDGSAGFRTWVTGVDQSAYGELTVRVPVSRHLAVVVAGGSYPSDPVRGVLAASYASVGMRLTSSSTRRVPSRELREALARAYGEAALAPDAAAVRLDVESVEWGVQRLRVEVAGASTVEIMGDFTDWVPVSLSRLNDHTFEITLPIAPGVHRLNLRFDGGPWLVPGGMRAEEDEFGGTVGVLVIS